MEFQRVVAATVCFALGVSALCLGEPAAAQESGAAPARSFEFRAVAMGTTEQAATDKLNALAAEGWDYVGPLANGLVAFRRPLAARDLAARKDGEKLQGVWTRVAVSHGETRRGENVSDTITYSGNTFVQKLAGAVIQGGTFKIVDAASNPRQLDYFVTAGTNKGKHYRAIYRIEGDVLHVCSDDGSNKRPREFARDAGFYRVARRKTP
jgi:uncharacterized protein (TIGR03067 family)